MINTIQFNLFFILFNVDGKVVGKRLMFVSDYNQEMFGRVVSINFDGFRGRVVQWELGGRLVWEIGKNRS